MKDVCGIKGVDRIFTISLDRRKDRWFEFFRMAKKNKSYS